MTLEQAKSDVVFYGRHSPQQRDKPLEQLIDKIYDNFEASNTLLIRASKYNSEIHAYEIERLKKKHKAEIKKAYFEGSNSTNELIQSLYKQIEQLKDRQ